MCVSPARVRPLTHAVQFGRVVAACIWVSLSSVMVAQFDPHFRIGKEPHARRQPRPCHAVQPAFTAEVVRLSLQCEEPTASCGKISSPEGSRPHP